MYKVLSSGLYDSFTLYSGVGGMGVIDGANVNVGVFVIAVGTGVSDVVTLKEGDFISNAVVFFGRVSDGVPVYCAG